MKYFSVGLIVAVVIIGAYLSITGADFYTREKSEIEGAVMGDSSVLFVGDMMFDRGIRSIGDDKGYLHLFSCAKEILLAETAVVGNLEGPITKNKSVSQGTKPGSTDNFQFTFDPQITDALLLSNIGYVSIGNNHILNFGYDGLDETKKYLTRAGIRYFGDPAEATTSVARIPLANRELALVNYNEFWHPNASTTVDLIEEEKNKGNFVVVYAHWGEEYASSTQDQAELAYTFIEAGADTVIGSHPHVVQEVEQYLGRPIFYSLGNFIFDQWFSDEVMRGMGVRITFGAEGEDPVFDTINFDLAKDGRVCPLTVVSE